MKEEQKGLEKDDWQVATRYLQLLQCNAQMVDDSVIMIIPEKLQHNHITALFCVTTKPNKCTARDKCFFKYRSKYSNSFRFFAAYSSL